MKIAIAQINPIIGDFNHNFKKMKYFADRATKLSCDLIVFSELVVSGYPPHDLLEKKEKLKRNDVALVRLEQLFPLPVHQLQKIIEKYKNANDIVWAQEEPKNMGAYAHILMNFEEAKNFRVCSRKVYATPASGSPSRFKSRHDSVIGSVFRKTIK